MLARDSVAELEDFDFPLILGNKIQFLYMGEIFDLRRHFAKRKLMDQKRDFALFILRKKTRETLTWTKHYKVFLNAINFIFYILGK